MAVASDARTQQAWPQPPERSSSLRTRIYALIGASAVILLSLAWVTHRETVEQGEAALLVEHTHLVIEALRRIPAGLGAAEASLRGYALERDERFLDEIEPALHGVEDAAATVRRLTADNPAQQRQLDALEPKLARRVRLLRDRATIVRSHGSAEMTPEARQLTYDIRADVGEMTHHEMLLLDSRRTAREAHTRRLQLVSPLGIFAGISLVVVAFVLVIREGRRREQAERAAGEQGEQLRNLVKETALMLQLGEMLSACRSIDEANDVVEQFAPRFFADASGGVCMLNESQNLLESHVRWGDLPLFEAATFAPDECWALRRGKPHRAKHDDATRCAHFADTQAAMLCLPLLANGHVVGTLHIADDGTDGEQVERRAMVMGEQVGMALSNLRLRETLRNQSIRDPLTGLFNRRYTDETLARELHRASREASVLSVLVMDVDFFKKFNDSFGHQAGDRVLASLGSLLRKKTRGSDIASRLGGEELAVVLPGAGIEDARRRAEDIRQEVSRMEVVYEGKDIGPITLSIGVAAYPEHGSTAEEIVRVADSALYRAKRDGRNRVVIAE